MLVDDEDGGEPRLEVIEDDRSDWEPDAQDAAERAFTAEPLKADNVPVRLPNA